MEKEEKDIRFVARFYRENRLDTTQAWQKLGIGKQRNNSILLYRLITIAAVTFLIAGFSWWWIYDRQDWIVIASSAHAVKEVTLPDNSHIISIECFPFQSYEHRALRAVTAVGSYLAAFRKTLI